jgi:hypothetical protein
VTRVMCDAAVMRVSGKTVESESIG